MFAVLNIFFTIIGPFVLAMSLASQAAATTITIPEHADFTITLLNEVEDDPLATDFHVVWKKGTKIKSATPDGENFTLTRVNKNPNEAIFDLGTGNGVPSLGTINLTFGKSFAPGSQFNVYFSYPDADIDLGFYIFPAILVDQHIGPPVPGFPRQLMVQPVPVALPATGVLLTFVLLCSGAFGRIIRRAHRHA